MYKIYSINGFGPEIYKIYKKNQYGIEIIEFYKKLLMVKIITKFKLRALRFGYVIAINTTIMHINFQMILWVTLKVMVSNLLNIAPHELKLVVYVKGSEVNIPTKFQVILKKLNFQWFHLRTVIYTFMVLKCMKFTRKNDFSSIL